MSVWGRATTVVVTCLGLALGASCNVHFDTAEYPIADASSLPEDATDMPESDLGLDSGTDAGDVADLGPGTDMMADALPGDVEVDAPTDMSPDVADLGVDMPPDTGPDATADVGVDMPDDNPCSALQPVVYWPLDTLDPGTQTYKTTDPNLPTPIIPSAMLPTVTGASGMAPMLDGVDDYLAVQHHDAFLLPEGSISVWVRREAGSIGGVFSKDASGTALGGHFKLEILDGGELEFRLQEQGASHYVNSLQTVPEDQWAHIVATFGADGMHLYIDGVLQGSTNYTGGWYDPNAPDTIRNEEPIALGALTNGSDTGSLFPMEDWMNTAIDEVSFFDRQLDPIEVQALRDPMCDLAP